MQFSVLLFIFNISILSAFPCVYGKLYKHIFKWLISHDLTVTPFLHISPSFFLFFFFCYNHRVRLDIFHRIICINYIYITSFVHLFKKTLSLYNVQDVLFSLERRAFGTLDPVNLMRGLGRKRSWSKKGNMMNYLKNRWFCDTVICSHYPWLMIGPWQVHCSGPQFHSCSH